MVHFDILALWRWRHDGLAVGPGLQGQLGVAIQRNGLLSRDLLALRIGSLLLARKCREGAEDLDLSPLLGGRDRLGLGLEEMQGLAVLLC